MIKRWVKYAGWFSLGAAVGFGTLLFWEDSLFKTAVKMQQRINELHEENLLMVRHVYDLTEAPTKEELASAVDWLYGIVNSSVPGSVTGNTSDSGSEDSRFDP